MKEGLETVEKLIDGNIGMGVVAAIALLVVGMALYVMIKIINKIK